MISLESSRSALSMNVRIFQPEADPLVRLWRGLWRRGVMVSIFACH